MTAPESHTAPSPVDVADALSTIQSASDRWTTDPYPKGALLEAAEVMSAAYHALHAEKMSHTATPVFIEPDPCPLHGIGHPRLSPAWRDWWIWLAVVVALTAGTAAALVVLP